MTDTTKTAETYATEAVMFATTDYIDTVLEKTREIAIRTVDAHHGLHERVRPMFERLNEIAGEKLEAMKAREEAGEEKPSAVSRMSERLLMQGAALAASRLAILEAEYAGTLDGLQRMIDFALDQCDCLPVTMGEVARMRQEAVALAPEPTLGHLDDEEYAKVIARDTEAAGNAVCQHLQRGELFPAEPSIEEIMAQIADMVGLDPETEGDNEEDTEFNA